jgi:hypothetical protein
LPIASYISGAAFGVQAAFNGATLVQLEFICSAVLQILLVVDSSIPVI